MLLPDSFLGNTLPQQDKIKDGVEEIKQAVVLESDPGAVHNYAQTVTGALEQHQCLLTNANAYNREVSKAEEAATQGEGNPKPMAVFKKKFVAALEQHTCPLSSPQ
jgi:hypothetical protein